MGTVRQAADERIKAAAPVCGVAVGTLRNRHVLGHCDCMYHHNPYRIDTAEFAGLIAPRPMLLCYAAEDSLYSRDEYQHLFTTHHAGRCGFQKQNVNGGKSMNR